MAQNHVREGKTFTWTNGTAADVVSGQVVQVGELMGVAQVDIPMGLSGELAVGEVWEVPYDGLADVDPGVQLYWDDTAGAMTLAAAGNIEAGKAWAPAPAGSTSVQINIGA